MTQQSQATWVESGVRELEASLNGGNRPLLGTLRKEALEHFQKLGFPTTKQEEWRYTNVQPIAKAALTVSRADGRAASELTPAALSEKLLISAETSRLVFVDGAYSEELSLAGSLGSGVQFGTLQSLLTVDSSRALVEQHLSRYASHTEQAFVALNTSLLVDGAAVIASRGAVASEPLLVVFVSTGKDARATSPRVLVVAEENAQVTVVEQYLGLGDAAYLTNTVTEIVAAQNAVVDHYRIQQEGPNAYHVSSVDIRQERGSNCATNSYSFGGALVRNEVNPTLDGEGCNTHMFGLNVVAGEQHVDNHTVLDHAKPHCESTEWYKGIYGGKSKGVFNGTIIVRQHAQKTNAIQSNQSLLLSPDAQSNSKPQLKIWADDVKCTHGATVGQLDENALFYLRSRGIPEVQARDILVHAFAGDILAKVRIDSLREALEQLVHQKLGELESQ